VGSAGTESASAAWITLGSRRLAPPGTREHAVSPDPPAQVTAVLSARRIHGAATPKPRATWTIRPAAAAHRVAAGGRSQAHGTKQRIRPNPPGGGRRLRPARRGPIMTAAHMSGAREDEHVITMRRPRAGIHWLVTHLESITQLLVITMRGPSPACGPPPRRSSRQASSWSMPLTCRRPVARHPAGTQASRSDRKLTSGKDPASRKPGPASSRSSTVDPVLTALVLAASRAVESSIGSAISTPPVRGRRPRTGRPANDTVNDACDWPDRAASCQRPVSAGRRVWAGRRASSWSRPSPSLAGSASRRLGGPGVLSGAQTPLCW
jgi:hypothetical protein